MARRSSRPTPRWRSRPRPPYRSRNARPTSPDREESRPRMSDQPRQLALDLPVAPRFGSEDFLVSPSNEGAYARIEAWPDWPDRVLVLTGPPGSGKSHLAAIFAERSGALTVPACAVTANA